MKALVYTATEESEYREEPDPATGPGDALISVEAVGICGSDMHAWHGHDPRRVPPLILGHEAVGTVLSGSTKGARVVLNPLISCGACHDCRIGRANLCKSRELIGMRIQGAFAEFVAIPARNLIPVPDGMDASLAALTEPCATAWHAITHTSRSLYRPLPESRALVIGGGAIGLLSALILKHFGCPSVSMAETNGLRRSMAAKAGIHVFDPVVAPAPDEGFDFVLDAVGATGTRAAAIRAAASGGVISHVGLLDRAGDLDARTLTLREITLVGVYTYTDADLRASLSALHAGFLGNLSWIERRPLSDGPRAFQDLHHGATAAAKIILQP